VASATIAANGSVQIDSGASDSDLYVTNTGSENCTLHPGGMTLRPGQATVYTINPGVAVTAKSRNGTSISYTVISASQPGTVSVVSAIDCGSSS
jgi:hypothetical protein